MSGNDKPFNHEEFIQNGWFHRESHHNHWHLNHYMPWYDDRADYNTNAKSYYDYLARFSYWQEVVEDIINRLLRRNIEVEDTKSIDFTKTGHWESDECGRYDDVIRLKADVIISKAVETRTFQHINPTIQNVPNGSKIVNDGVWSPDYINVLNSIDDKIGELETIINNQGDIINNLTHALQQIIDNLYNSGAINNNTWNFTFNTGRNLATGNINVFGGTQDGNSFIRTNKGKTENDITVGI